MKIIRPFLIGLLWCSLPLFSGCERFMDCAVHVRPKLSGDDLPNGKKGQNYNAVIRGEVSNGSVFDQTYSVTGSLPQGIGYSIIGNEVRLYGVPLNAGTFAITVRLILSNYQGDGEEPCNVDHETSRKYGFTIKE